MIDALHADALHADAVSRLTAWAAGDLAKDQQSLAQAYLSYLAARSDALWRSCDAPLRPVVEGARTQLARMVAEPR